MMIGRSLSKSLPPALSEPGAPVLEIRGLSGGRVRDISFAVRAGEILGFAGLVGAGRSEILRMLYAADPILSGEMQLDGRQYHPRSPSDAIRAGVVLVPEERRSQGLILSRSIQENISLPHLSRLARGAFFLNPKKEMALSQRTSQSVLLKAVSPHQITAQLSGGNQQKVVFARWLAEEVRVLLLDEPTRGVDVGARFEIYRIIRALAEQGAAVVLVSSDLPELLGLANRVIVLREGRQTAELAKEDLTQERVLRFCYGEEQ
jgi:ABC-type sugar transport system ATPase subunit